MYIFFCPSNKSPYMSRIISASVCAVCAAQSVNVFAQGITTLSRVMVDHFNYFDFYGVADISFAISCTASYTELSRQQICAEALHASLGRSSSYWMICVKWESCRSWHTFRGNLKLDFGKIFVMSKKNLTPKKSQLAEKQHFSIGTIVIVILLSVRTA